MSSDEVFFKWSSYYDVNIPAIDEQHRELVNMLNRLFVAISKREGEKIIAEILDALMIYTKTHFSLEERLMKEAHYHDVEAHTREHKKLLNDLEVLARKYLVDERPIYFEMLSFLRSWLREHILGSDMKYSIALQAAGFSTLTWEQQAKAEFSAVTSNKKQWWKRWQTT